MREPGEQDETGEGIIENELNGRSRKSVANILNESTNGCRLVAKNPQEFIAMLKSRFGNLVQAWRRILDPYGKGTLTLCEFGSALRSLHYAGSIHELWLHFDTGDGQICLAEIDKVASDLLQDFKEFLEDNYKTAESAWRAMVSQGRIVLRMREFSERCKYVGWTRDCDRLFHFICSGSKGFPMVTLEDIEWLGLPAHDAKLHPLQAIRQHMEGKAKEINTRMGPCSLLGLKTLLRRKFGNMVRGWRLALDSDGNGMLTYNEFIVALRSQGYEGSLRQLWETLNEDGDGSISLYELCPDSAQQLHSFKEHLFERYKTVHLAWKALDPKGLKFLTGDGFVMACGRIRFKAATGIPGIRQLHTLLDCNTLLTSRGRLHITDIAWLKNFQPGVEGNEVGIDEVDIDMRKGSRESK